MKDSLSAQELMNRRLDGRKVREVKMHKDELAHIRSLGVPGRMRLDVFNGLEIRLLRAAPDVDPSILRVQNSSKFETNT